MFILCLAYLNELVDDLWSDLNLQKLPISTNKLIDAILCLNAVIMARFHRLHKEQIDPLRSI
jgi:hypothetical protein